MTPRQRQAAKTNWRLFRIAGAMRSLHVLNYEINRSRDGRYLRIQTRIAELEDLLKAYAKEQGDKEMWMLNQLIGDKK